MEHIFYLLPYSYQNFSQLKLPPIYLCAWFASSYKKNVAIGLADISGLQKLFFDKITSYFFLFSNFKDLNISLLFDMPESLPPNWKIWKYMNYWARNRLPCVWSW